MKYVDHTQLYDDMKGLILCVAAVVGVWMMMMMMMMIRRRGMKLEKGARAHKSIKTVMNKVVASLDDPRALTS